MQSLTLVHSDTFPIARYLMALAGEAISSRGVSSLDGLQARDPASLRVLLLDAAMADGSEAPPQLDSGTAIVGVGLDTQPRWLGEDSIYLHLPVEPTPAVLLSAIKRAYQFLYQKQRADQLEKQLSERTRELRQVSEVGSALSTVRDHSVLLSMILVKARELSRADAGSLYLIDEMYGEKVLRWIVAQNDSIDTEAFEERLLPITRTSLAGYVAMTGEALVIDDAYNLPAGTEYEINRTFDETNGYLTKSLLVFPMTNHNGDVIGVLQLINRRKAGISGRLTAATVPASVVPFDQDTVEIMRALASQAAVAVENNLLYESIERLFEGFVTAAVTAIEQRDPTTSGHSFRVADLTVELARVIDHVDSGIYAGLRFNAEQIRELRYASLLHDFGKVVVREQVLVKEKKLYPFALETIRGRFEFLMKSIESEANAKKIDYLLAHGREGWDRFSAELDAKTATRLAGLQRDFDAVSHSNEPTILPEGEFEHLQALARTEFIDIRGERRLLVEPDEARILSIRKGNLDAAERLEIESHVTHTFNFLLKIPWTRDLASVAEIAYAHHEKLNGRGYPRRLSADEIPVQSRMMTVADIYDALTASDRPYKRALSTERALDILNLEVSEGLLDQTLVDTFIEAKVYERAGVLRT